MIAIRFWKPMNVSGSPVSSSENWSARCSTPRESWLEIVVIAGAEQPDREHDRGHRGRGAERVARRQPLAQPGGGEHAERGDDREVEQPVRDVAVVHVAELVGDDQAHLVRGEVLQQVVVEDDALRAPDARSRTRWRRSCGARRPSRRPGRRRRPPRARARARSERVGPAGRGVKLVEQRVEDDRRQVGRHDAEGDTTAAAGAHQRAAEAAHAEDQQRAARAREHARRSRCSWRRRRRSPSTPGSPGRHPWPARARSRARAASRRRSRRTAPRRPRRRPAPCAGAAAAGRAAAARRRAPGRPSSIAVRAPSSHSWPVRKSSAFSICAALK